MKFRNKKWWENDGVRVVVPMKTLGRSQTRDLRWFDEQRLEVNGRDRKVTVG